MSARFSIPRNLAAAQAPRLWPWACTGAVLGVLWVLLAFAPATWLAAGLAHWSQGKVQLAQAQGSVWDGSARLLLAPGGQKPVLLPGRVRWTAKVQGLGLRLNLLPDCCASRPAQIVFSPGLWSPSVVVQDLDIRLPATLLAGLGTPFNTLGFGGTVVVTSPKVQVQMHAQQWQLEGAAQLQLLQLSSSLSTLPALGSYQIDVQGGRKPKVDLRTLDGALQMQGAGSWQNGRFGFQGQAQAAPGYEDALANILNVIGQRNGAVSVIRI